MVRGKKTWKIAARKATLALEHLESRRLLSATADFNGDGFADLAIGVTGESVNGTTAAGAVNIIYGSASGLDSAGNQIWHLDSPGLLGDPEPYGWFGWALATGDFDGDGYGDLAIGSPYMDVSGKAAAGVVHTLYGSPAGLTSTGSERLHQDNPRVRDVAEAGDYFGSALASGDFNLDGYDDLAVGVPGEDNGALTDAGGVAIFYGTSSGLSAPGNQFFTQDTPNIPGVGASGDEFGASLAVGDFDNDNFADLAIGVPGDDANGVNGAGVVNILYGGGGGLVAVGSQWFYQSDTAALDGFGSSVATGDFDNDGFDDLLVGVPGEDVGAATNAGAINVVYGTASGLSVAGAQKFVQGNFGQTSESWDHFGRTVAAGDLDGDGFDDVIAAAPTEDVGAVIDAGAVFVLFGAGAGVSGAGSVTWTQENWAGQTSEYGDYFGSGLAVGDFNNGGITDLAIGAPLKDVGSITDAGAVFIVSAGFASSVWHQNSPGILGVAEEGDLFGAPMAGAGPGSGGESNGGDGAMIVAIDANAPVGTAITGGQTTDDEPITPMSATEELPPGIPMTRTLAPRRLASANEQDLFGDPLSL